MKQFVIVFLILFSTTLVFCQEEIQPKTDFTRMYLPVWLEAQAHCLEVAEAMRCKTKYSRCI